MINSSDVREKSGIAQGDVAPDFELTDTKDQKVRLSDFRGKKNVVLVLNRSLVCPFCRRHMVQMGHDYAEFVKRGAEVIILGPNSPENFKRTWDIEELAMIGLSDPDSVIANSYHQEVKFMRMGRLPALLVLDKKGIIRFLHYGKSMTDIPENSQVFQILDEINNQKK
jgi:peroxiredoxin Q/BCP